MRMPRRRRQHDAGHLAVPTTDAAACRFDRLENLELASPADLTREQIVRALAHPSQTLALIHLMCPKREFVQGVHVSGAQTNVSALALSRVSHARMGGHSGRQSSQVQATLTPCTHPGPGGDSATSPLR
jgi:hypothetical protein